jgi:hypothetical protein
MVDESFKLLNLDHLFKYSIDVIVKVMSNEYF